MGRKKGGKNKIKTMEIIRPITGNLATDVPLIGFKEKTKKRREYIPEDPTLVITKTVYKTPIAITDICKTEGDCYFVVIPHYKDRSSKTTINSRSVIKPVFATPEIEKEFDGIVFATKEIEPIEIADPEAVPVEDTLNDTGTLNDADEEK